MSNKKLKSLLSLVIITIFLVSNFSINFAVENQSSTGTTENNTPDQGAGAPEDTGDNKSQTGEGTGDSGTKSGDKKTTEPTTTPAKKTKTNQTDDEVLSPVEELILVIYATIQALAPTLLKTEFLFGNKYVSLRDKQNQNAVKLLFILMLILVRYIPEPNTLPDFYTA
jgi:hypothetical protein